MKKIFPLVIMVFATCIVQAQKIKVIEGDLKKLKGVKSFNTEFSYSPMTVGKTEDEKVYVAEKKKNMNDKEAGRGDKWEKAWIADRKDRFEPQFRELFAKHSGMSVVDEKSPYTLIFKTTRTEPGWNVGVMKVPAYIDAQVWIVETNNKDNVIAKLDVKNSPGRSAYGMDWETGARLQEAYAKAGKSLGGYIKNNTK
jgi:hypothetical protein